MESLHLWFLLIFDGICDKTSLYMKPCWFPNRILNTLDGDLWCSRLFKLTRFISLINIINFRPLLINTSLRNLKCLSRTKSGLQQCLHLTKRHLQALFKAENVAILLKKTSLFHSIVNLLSNLNLISIKHSPINFQSFKKV